MQQGALTMFSRSRPTGVTIIATLMLIGALLSLCGGLTALIGAPFNILQLDIGGLFADSFSALFAIVLAVANLILASGLFNLQKWAYWITVLIQGLAVVNGLRGGSWGLFSMIIPLIVVAYLLLDQRVRAAFRT
jgi:lysylphosphatidylglycerol synthetase-like protein (DUF2156 family)